MPNTICAAPAPLTSSSNVLLTGYQPVTHHPATLALLAGPFVVLSLLRHRRG